MTDQPHHWITLHRVRLPDIVSATAHSLEAPAGVDCWRCCPSQIIGDDGLPTWASNTWCGLALHNTEEGARALHENPSAHLPWLSNAVEQWHALAVPAAHHGALNWRGHVEENSDYVGKEFASEARKIHLGEAPERAIYGEAKLDEAKSLIEDGVPVAPLPFVPSRKTN